METYSESAEGIRITRKRALQELDSHGMKADDVAWFDLEVEAGEDALYDAQEVLSWLGY
jgi:hypothetical protein